MISYEGVIELKRLMGCFPERKVQKEIRVKC